MRQKKKEEDGAKTAHPDPSIEFTYERKCKSEIIDKSRYIIMLMHLLYWSG